VERHYTEQEVTEVIRRAAELQERLAPSDVPRPSGVRESELVRIAVELGLDERFVRDALSDPTTFAQDDKGKLTSVDRTLERIAAGLPGSEAFEIALDEFGPTAGLQSGPTTVGDTMTYQSMVGLSHCEMLVSKKGGRTRVKVGVSTFLPVIAVALPVMLAVGILAGVVGESMGPAAGWGLAALGVVLDWFVMRRTIKWSNIKVLEKLEALVSRLNREAGKVSQDGDGEQARIQ
jgi:hypothetical protein